MHEDELISCYFSNLGCQRDDVIFGVGDDAAITYVPANKQLVTTVDTFIENIHFLPFTSPDAIAHKALAVNLSDLAAMGAEPAWITTVLTLPEINMDWIKRFSATLDEQLKQYNVQLIGGDISRGPLSVTIQAQGFVAKGQGMRRDAAHVGDSIVVSGYLGAASLGLDHLRGKLQLSGEALTEALQHFHRPIPRLALGQMLSSSVKAAIDISDGLLLDLTRMMKASGCGAILDLESIPILGSLLHSMDKQSLYPYALSGGEDYELCCCMNEGQIEILNRTLQAQPNPVMLTKIGEVVAGNEIKVLLPTGKSYNVNNEKGYLHFY